MTESDDLYQYFNCFSSYADIMLNHHKIEKAIRHAIGMRDFDKRIKKIWERVLSEVTIHPKNIYNVRYSIDVGDGCSRYT